MQAVEEIVKRRVGRTTTGRRIMDMADENNWWFAQQQLMTPEESILMIRTELKKFYEENR